MNEFWQGVLVSSAVALCIAVTGWWLAARRTRVTVMYSIWPIALHQPRPGITVSFRDRQLAHPNLVIFQVTNHGPRDLSVSDFDGGELGIDIKGAELLAELETTPGPGGVELSLDAGKVRLKPQLLQRGATAHVQVLVEGAPQVASVARLAQVRVLRRDPLPLRWLALIGAAAIYYVAVVFYVLATSWSRLGNAADANLFMSGALLGLIFGPLLYLGTRQFVRRRRRRAHRLRGSDDSP